MNQMFSFANRSSQYITWLVSSGLVFIIVVTLAIANRAYRVAFDETELRQGLQQLEVARSAALGIEYFLKHVREDLQLISSGSHLQAFGADSIRANLDHFYQHAEREAAMRLFLVDKRHQILYANGGPLPAWLFPLIEQRLVEHDGEEALRPWLSKVVLVDPQAEDRKLCVAMLLPVTHFEAPQDGTEGKYEILGIIGYLIDFDWLMQEFIEPVQFGESGFAWVMDKHGRLLHHPKHREMILRSIYEPGPSCGACHDSFTKHDTMISGRVQVQEYQVGSEPERIVAHAPMRVVNEEWIVAVASDLSEVTATVGENFRLFFWLVGLVLTSIIIGAVLLIYLNTRRVRAEANARHLEEKRLLEGQVYHAAKLASIGELVDSVAHEINTPVGIISAQIDGLLLEKQSLPFAEILQIIRGQTRRIGVYTKSLLRFSRRMAFQPRPTNLNEVLEECLVLLGHRFRAKHVNIEKKWAQNGRHITVDRNQVEQVVLNLLNNAVDAVNQDGRVTVSMEYTEEPEDGVGIQIIIEDDGPGIKTDDLERIFEPFFSTKPLDKGTGLGLSISRAIVQRHGGWIKARDRHGAGASFTVFLPDREENGR